MRPRDERLTAFVELKSESRFGHSTPLTDNSPIAAWAQHRSRQSALQFCLAITPLAEVPEWGVAAVSGEETVYNPGGVRTN
jgi:hypothetical protein